MNELLIKTIINQARTIERYDVQACADIGLKAEVKDLEKRLETVIKKFNGQRLLLKGSQNTLTQLEEAQKRIKELESLQVFHTEESYDQDPEMYDDGNESHYPEEEHE